MVEGELHPGQMVLMELVLPGELQPLLARARICHRENSACGLQFVAPDQRSKEQIATAYRLAGRSTARS